MKYVSSLSRVAKTASLAAGMVALSAASAFADAPTPNKGDTTWMLVATALVILMTIPGLALFYGGMVRKKNVLATVMQSFAITCLVSVLWLVVGYSLAFTPGSTILGGLSRIFLKGLTLDGVHELAKTIPETVFICFQLTFAAIPSAPGQRMARRRSAISVRTGRLGARISLTRTPARAAAGGPPAWASRGRRAAHGPDCAARRVRRP